MLESNIPTNLSSEEIRRLVQAMALEPDTPAPTRLKALERLYEWQGSKDDVETERERLYKRFLGEDIEGGGDKGGA